MSHRNCSTPSLLPEVNGLQNSADDSDESFLSVKPAQNSVDIIRNKNQELVSQIHRLKIKVREADVNYFSAKMASDNLRNENINIKEELIDQRTKIKQLTVENRGKDTEIKRLREKSKAQKDTISTLNAEVNSLKKIASDLEDLLTEMKTMPKDERLSDLLREQKQELDQAEIEIKELSNKVQEYENERINLQSEIAFNRTEIDDMKMQFTNFIAEFRNKDEILREEMQAENKQRDAEVKQEFLDVKTKQDEILSAIRQVSITSPVRETISNANIEEVNLASRMPKIDAQFRNIKDQRQLQPSRYWKPAGKIPTGINTLPQPIVGMGPGRLVGNKPKMLSQKYKQQPQLQPNQRQFSSQSWMKQ